VKQSDTFAHSRTQTQPRPHIFAYYLEETCRLLAADRGLSDAMGMRFPHAAATEAAKTRLFELSGTRGRRTQPGQAASDSPLTNARPRQRRPPPRPARPSTEPLDGAAAHQDLDRFL
jgi:hypothetical protein